MTELLAIEWLKIKRYRTFWVLAGLFLLLLPLWNYEVGHGLIKLGGGGGGMNFLSTAYSFPQVWSNIGFWGSIFILFISILVIILTTNEYGYRTHRQNVIDGWSRMQFFHAKVLLVVVLSLLCTIYMFILGAVFGRMTQGSFSDFGSEIKQVSYFFLLSLNYLGFALVLALLIRRSGLAIGLFLLYSMIIENILKGIINHYTTVPYGNFLFLQCSDELLPFPFMRTLNTLLGQQGIATSTYCMVTLTWCAVYYFAGRLLLQKSDW